MNTRIPALAIFDLCDTLFAANTTFEFLRFYAAERPLPKLNNALERWSNRKSPLFYVAAAALRIAGVDLPRRYAIAALKGENRANLARAAETFAARILPPLANESVLQRLEDHRRRGDEIVIVSSSLDIVVAPIASKLGVDYLATTLGFEGNICTGSINRDLTGAKLAALEEHHGLSGKLLHVYTDNRSDAELLRAANHPTVVIPRGRKKDRWGGSACEYVEL